MAGLCRAGGRKRGYWSTHGWAVQGWRTDGTEMCQCSWKDTYCFGRVAFHRCRIRRRGSAGPAVRRTERRDARVLGRYFVADAESSVIKFTHAFESPFLTGQ